MDHNGEIFQRVEVCKKGTPGVYYPATILAVLGSELIGRVIFIVRYNDGGDEAGRKLIEAVDWEELRPEPPYYEYRGRGRVDAFVESAWRVGIVTKKVGNFYHVKLAYGDQEYSVTEVRIHFEWKSKKWHADEDTNMGTGSAQESQAADDGNQVITEDQGGQPNNLMVEVCRKIEPGVFYPATLLGVTKCDEIGRSTYKVRYETRINPENGTKVIEDATWDEVRPLPPPYHYFDASIVGYKVDAFLDCAWRVGVVTKTLNSWHYVKVNCFGDEQFCAFKLIRPHLDWKCKKWWFIDAPRRWFSLETGQESTSVTLPRRKRSRRQHKSENEQPNFSQ